MKNPVPDGAQLNIALSTLQVDPANARSSFDPEALEDLAGSMEAVGLLQPIIVREAETDGFIVVCGHRRLAAAKNLGWGTIPAIIRHLDTAAAADLALIENLQREDLTPIDEAEGYAKLAAAGHTVEEIATTLHRSRSVVHGRLALVGLPSDALQAMRDRRMTAAVGTLIGRLPSSDQREAATKAVLEQERQHWDSDAEETVVEPMAFNSVKGMLRSRFMLSLDSAPFDANDSQLVPASGSCAACGHRTGNAVDLFGDVLAGRGGSDICTYPVCFELKRQATVDFVLAKAREAGMATLSAKNMKRAFHPSGHVAYSGGYVGADELRPGSKKTWRTSLGKRAPQEHVGCNPLGKAVSLYLKKDVDALVEPEAEKRVGKKSATPGERADDARKRAGEIRTRAFGAIGDALVESANAQWPLLRSSIALQLLTNADLAYYTTDRRGLGESEDLALYVGSLSDIAVDGLIAELALADILYDALNGWRFSDESREIVAGVERACGFDIKDVLRKAADSLDAEAGVGSGHE